MKLLAYFLACLLILSNTTDAEAANKKDIFLSVQYEITNYYLAGGVWELQKIDSAEFVHTESEEYILVNAKTRIKNLATGKKTKETCLLSFVQQNDEFHSINCF